MVRGLVKQQHVRFLQENLSQFDTHTPASRELRGWPFEVRTQETQSYERPFELCLATLGTHHQVAIVFRRVLLYQGEIALTLVVRPLSQFIVHPVEPFLHLRDVCKGFLSLLADGRIVLKDHHLRQVTDTTVVGNAHHSCRRLLLSAENLQHRRLAGTVLSHKGNAVAIVDDETRISEQRLYAKLYFQALYGYHKIDDLFLTLIDEHIIFVLLPGETEHLVRDAARLEVGDLDGRPDDGHLDS